MEKDYRGDDRLCEKSKEVSSTKNGEGRYFIVFSQGDQRGESLVVKHLIRVYHRKIL